MVRPEEHMGAPTTAEVEYADRLRPRIMEELSRRAAEPEILGRGAVGPQAAERSLAGDAYAEAEERGHHLWVSEESALQTVQRAGPRTSGQTMGARRHRERPNRLGDGRSLRAVRPAYRLLEKPRPHPTGSRPPSSRTLSSPRTAAWMPSGSASPTLMHHGSQPRRSMSGSTIIGGADQFRPTTT